VSWAAAAVWASALAVSTGAAGITEPLRSRFDYWAVVPEVRRLGLAEFVQTYVARLDSYPVHVEGHPPGLPLLYGIADRLGLRGTGWAAAIVIVIGSSTVAAVAIAVRALAGEGAARTAVPFLVLAPFALFVATTGDAVFMALSAWAIALAARACTGTGTTSDRSAAAAGVTAAFAAFFTYGVVPLLALAFGAVAVRTRRLRPMVIAGAGAASVTALWRLLGFDWFDGFAAARHFYRLRAGDERPYLYFLVANLAVFAVMLGPAVLAGLTVVRDRAVILFVAVGLAAVALADLSGLSKAEVERIWLPFMPWITLAVVDLVRQRRRQAGAWLAAQASLAIGLQLCIGWPW
jgi:hypothetical protein